MHWIWTTAQHQKFAVCSRLTPYCPQNEQFSGGQKKRTNKNQIKNKSKNKKNSTRTTHFSLAYGIGTVLPIEVDITFLQVLSELNLDEANPNPIWSVKFDWRGKIQGYPSWSKVPKIKYASSPKSSPQRPDIEEYSCHTKGLQKKMDAKLERTLCGRPYLKKRWYWQDGWQEPA